MNKNIKSELEKKYIPKKKYIRAKEVASVYEIPLSTLWWNVRQGNITTKKVSSRVTLFNIDDIEKINKERNITYDKSKYLRAKEVALYAGIGLSTVWHYAKIGKLTPKKINANISVFLIEDLEKFINEGGKNE